MAAIGLFLHVAAATMLLLFAVRTVQKGIQTYATVTLRRVFAGKGGQAKSILAGLGAAILLQSSAAVALLTANFVSSGLIRFAPALAVILGADFGSALVVVILSFSVGWVLTACLALGGWLYLKTKTPLTRQIGQILLGVGLILLSLQLLSDAFEPVRTSPLWPAGMGYLQSDLITAFLVGAALAFAIHSSVATVLMCIALAQLGAVPLPVGVALTLGANLGSSLIPLWLTRGAKPRARRVIWGNVIVRGAAALCAITLGLIIWPGLPFQVGTPAQTLMALHLAFNAGLLMSVPFLNPLGRLLDHLLPDPNTPRDGIEQWQSETCLTSTSTPALACANMRREVLRMSTFLSGMAENALTLYRTAAATDRARMTRMNAAMQDTLDAIRTYAADLSFDDLTKAGRRDMRDLMDVAVDLTAASHVIADRFVDFAQTIQTDHLTFSKAGWAELEALNNLVVQNMSLAFGALAANDTALARTVVEAKADVRKLERRSRKQHFERLRNGEADSFASSDVHLETLRALKELNSKITETVYPMLTRSGQLSDTRLIPERS